MKPVPDPTPMLAQAVALHQQGGLAAAAGLYRQILRQAPRHFDALRLLGFVECQQGHPAEACKLLTAALAVNPRAPEVLAMRGNVLLQLGRLAEALASYERALAIKPDLAETLGRRGDILHEFQRHDDALASYDRALAIKANAPQTWNNRGTCLQKLQRPADALASYERALELQPDYPEARHNRAKSLLVLKRFGAAVAAYDRLLERQPDDLAALVNRGNALQPLLRFEEAVDSYDRALLLQPDDVLTLVARGNALRRLRRHLDAIASYDRALELKPEHAKALFDRGDALCDLARYEEAAGDFVRLLCIAPDYPLARGALFDARAQCCDWREFASDRDSIVAAVEAGKLCALAFVFLAVADSTRAQLACARTYVDACYPPAPAAVFTAAGSPHGKIRLAYLSGDLRAHAVSYLMAGVFERHDRSRFEIIAVSFLPPDSSAQGRRVANAFDRFIDVSGMGDPEVADLLRGLEIDIAIDLMGFTGANRTAILAHRPAPVQVSYLGFPGTMGAPYIDYLFADHYVIPADQRANYAEQVAYLPDCFQANDASRVIAEETATRSDEGLPESGFVFCCFNNCYKITPQVFDVWMRLLAAVEGSVLWLVLDREAVAGNLRREAAARGVAPDRLVFAPRVAYPQHLARYRLADLFLDTLPFNAGTTASDALWAGLPLLTCSGEAFAARMAGSLLHTLGLPELVTSSLPDYENLARSLASDPAGLAEIRAKLARNRLTYPLFDTARFTRHLEAALLTMWRRHQRGEPPAGFAVEG